PSEPPASLSQPARQARLAAGQAAAGSQEACLATEAWTMKRFGRLHKGLVFLVVMALVGVALIGCARLYLTSRYASDQIAEQVQAVLGVPVRTEEVEVGLTGDSFLRNLQVYEADGQRPDTPWLTIEDIRADLSAADVVGGDATPRHLVLSTASLNLRFDANGHL